jgi:O-antigen ligase
LESPILGHGPAKSIYTGVITDSEDLDVLKKFGLMGFLIYLAYFLWPLGLAWKGLKGARRGGPFLEERLSATVLTVRLSFIMCVMALAMNVFMSTFQNLSLQGFLWLWLGLGAGAARTIRDSLRNSDLVSEVAPGVLAS